MTFEVIYTPSDTMQSEKREVQRFENLDSAYSAALGFADTRMSTAETKRKWKVQIKDTDRNVHMDLTAM